MKRILALLLALIMTLGMLPMNVWATGETDPSDGVAITEPAPVTPTVYKHSGDVVHSQGVLYFFTDFDEATQSLSVNQNDYSWKSNTDITFSYPGETYSIVYWAIPENTRLQKDDNIESPIAQWVINSQNYSVYSIRAAKPTDGYTDEYTLTCLDVNNFTPVKVTFDFAPVFTNSGNAGRFFGAYIFTEKNGTVLSYDGSARQWGDGSGAHVTISCADATQGMTAYLAVSPRETLTASGLTPVGRLNGTFVNNNGETYTEQLNLYTLSVPYPTEGLEVKIPASITWSDGTGMDFNYIFDFAQVYTNSGDTFRGCDVFLFTEKNGTVLSYNGAAKQWGNQDGEHVTLYCMPETESKTVYLAAWPDNVLEADGLKLIGKWNRVFRPDDSDHDVTEAFDLYSLTVTKPEDGFIAEIPAVHSWFEYENGELIGRHDWEFTYIFDFENHSAKLWRSQNEGWTDEKEHIERGLTRSFRLAVGTPISRIGLTQSNCTVKLVGDLGQLRWVNNGTEIEIDTVTATERYGSIKATYNGQTYELPIEVYFREMRTPDADGLREWVDAEAGFVYNLELYIQKWIEEEDREVWERVNPNYELTYRTASGEELPEGTFVWEENDTLTFDARPLNDTYYPIELSVIDDEGRYNTLMVYDHFNDYGDRTYWKRYKTNENTAGKYEYGGNSNFIIKLTPEQAKFIELPEALTANNELIITLHDPGEEVWCEIAALGEDPTIQCEYECLSGVGTNGEKPMVKDWSGGGDDEYILDWLNDPAYDYYNYDEGRGGGIFYAWVTKDNGRTVIIPQSFEHKTAWMWKYSDGTELADIVTVKFVLGDDIGNAIVLNNSDIPHIPASRISIKDSYTNLDTIFDASYDETTGVFTYRYTGPVTPAEGQYPSDFINQIVDQKLKADGLFGEGMGHQWWPVMEITSPMLGYRPKSIGQDSYTWDTGEIMEMPYSWHGINMLSTTELVWENAEGDTISEFITLETPVIDGIESWMEHLKDGNAKPIDVDRVIVTELDEETCGASVEVTPGLLYTRFSQDTMLEVDPILEASVAIKAPVDQNGNLPVAYKLVEPGDGSLDHSAYNNIVGERNVQWVGNLVETTERRSLLELENGDKFTDPYPLYALEAQDIGDIRYYYSADRGVSVLFVKWIYDLENEDQGAVYEYIEKDVSPYFLQWKEEIKADEEITEEVEKPTATNGELAESNWQLVSRIHPQNMSGHFFFELEVVDGVGNVVTETTEHEFRIILPYSFLGVDKNGNPWTYETASLMKAPMITHYDDDFTIKNNNGTLIGKFTERGIEFVVDSFSPFTLSWDETIPEAVEDGQKIVVSDIEENTYNTLPAKFDTVAEIKEELSKKAEELKPSLATNLEFYDLQLMVLENGVWVEKDGVPVKLFFPYPEGTDANTNFRVFHMFDHGVRAGQVEILKPIEYVGDGFYVKASSTSPFALAWTTEEIVDPTPAPETPTTPNTPSSSGSTYYSDLNEFWRDVEEKIEKAKDGETVEVELGKTDKLAWFIIDALRSNPDVGLKLTKNGKVVVEIPAGKAIANEAGRAYYSIDDLAELYSKYPEGNIPAEEMPEAIPVPEEEPEQPEEPSTVVPEEEPAEEVEEPEQPVVEETEEAPSRGSAKGIVIGIAAVAAIAVAAILVITLRKKEL